jgi:PAS domain S-box-containing protein
MIIKKMSDPARILLADDGTIRRARKRVLEEEGYEVVEAADSATILTKCRLLTLDLVIINALLPDIDGDEILNQLQNQAIANPVPILIITENTEEAIERAYQHGAADCMTSPVPISAFRQHVRQLLKQQQLEQAFAEQQQQFQALIDHLPESISVKDWQSRYIATNIIYRQEIGATNPEDILGKTVFELFPQDIATVYAADDQALIQSGVPLLEMERERLKQGKLGWVSVSKIPLRDRRGQIIRIMDITRDITQRKQVEAALKQRDEQFQRLAEATFEGIVIHESGRILELNQALATMFGYRPDELIGKTVFELVTLESRAVMENNIQTQYENPYEVIGLRKEGRRFHIEIHWRKYPCQGQIIQVLAFRDITERKQVEEALKAKAQEEHEFRTYLKALHGIVIELTAINDLDEFYKAAVALGLQRLGFDRLGFLLYDAEHSSAIGTYGTDAYGMLTDERKLRLDPSHLTNILQRAFQKEERFALDEQAQLYSNFQPIGLGWNAAAVLWNGSEKLGWLAIDNGVKHLPVSKPQIELLVLYALALGSLLVQKRTQINLQESEARLRQSEAKFATAFRASPAAIAIARVSDGRWIEVNESLAKMTGYSSEELIGHTSAELGLVDESSRDKVLEAIQLHGRVRDVEIQMRTRSNQVRELLMSSEYIELDDEVCALTIQYDITQLKSMEAALSESEERYRGLFENAPIGISIGYGTVRTYVNPAFMRMFGYDNITEILSISALEQIAPECREDILSLIQSDPPPLNQSVTFESLGQRKDGTFFPVQIQLGRLELAEGTRRVIFVSDISTRKQAEIALRENEQKLQTFFEVLPVGVSVMDKAGRIIEMNPALEKIFSFSKTNTYPSYRYIHNDGTPLPLSEFPGTQAFTTQKTVHDMEIGVIKEDGQLVWTSISAAPLPPGNSGVIVVTLDITERKRAENRFRSLIESAPDAMIIVDQQGQITLVNSRTEAVFGYDRVDMIGRPIEMLIPERFHKRHIVHRNAYITEPRVQSMGIGLELYALRKDGSQFPVEVNLSPIETAEGVLIASTIRNITERKQAEKLLAEQAQELARSNQELEQFAYIASHDLQEPLRMVTSYMGLLSQRYAGKLDEKADKYIGFAVDGAMRMQELINDLLAYSRVGSREPNLLQVEMETVLDTVLQNLSVVIKETQAAITHDPLPSVWADKTTIVQLLQNLIGNAIKFRGMSVPQVHITANTQEKSWLFSVQDNGIGIDAEYSEQVFEIFKRLHTRKEYSGTGLGLAICKKIIERHGGRIWLESEVGKGSTFYFSLPQKE